MKVGEATMPELFCTWDTSMTLVVSRVPPWSPPTASSHTSLVLSGLVDVKELGAVAASAIASECRSRALVMVPAAPKAPSCKPVNVARSTLARGVPAAAQPAPTVEQKPPDTYTVSPIRRAAALPRSDVSCGTVVRTHRPRAPGGSGRAASAAGVFAPAST